jgi:hypothetical protein
LKKQFLSSYIALSNWIWKIYHIDIILRPKLCQFVQFEISPSMSHKIFIFFKITHLHQGYCFDKLLKTSKKNYYNYKNIVYQYNSTRRDLIKKVTSQGSRYFQIRRRSDFSFREVFSELRWERGDCSLCWYWWNLLAITVKNFFSLSCISEDLKPSNFLR